MDNGFITGKVGSTNSEIWGRKEKRHWGVFILSHPPFNSSPTLLSTYQHCATREEVGLVTRIGNERERSGIDKSSPKTWAWSTPVGVGPVPRTNSPGERK